MQTMIGARNWDAFLAFLGEAVRRFPDLLEVRKVQSWLLRVLSTTNTDDRQRYGALQLLAKRYGGVAKYHWESPETNTESNTEGNLESNIVLLKHTNQGLEPVPLVACRPKPDP
jgi:hypothetical protein